MGLFGKFAKAIIANAAESAGDNEKSDKTATPAKLSKMEKEIQGDLEQLRKDKEALVKKHKKTAMKLY